MRIALSLVFALLFLVSQPNTSYALVEGCNPDVWEATKATAEGRVAQDVAVAEEISNQPDSVHALGCSDQAFKVSAEDGGNIFSGDFTTEMNAVVQDPLQELLTSNFVDSIGNSDDFANVVGGYLEDLIARMLGIGSFECTVMQDLYDDYLTTGIDGNAPYMNLDELVDAAFDGGGSTFLDNLAAEGSGGVFENLQTTRDALPANTIPSAAGATTFEDVLSAVGVLP